MVLGFGKKRENKSFLKKFKRNKPDTHTVSIVKLMQEKNYEEALKLHEPVLKEESADDWYTKGYLLGNLNKIEAPIECYDKAISLDPRYVKAWYRKGHCLLKLKKFLESAKCFEKVMEFEEENINQGKKEHWAAAAVLSLMIAYISGYNRLAAENKLTVNVKESTNLWKEKCYNFFKENELIPEDTPESTFLENSIKNFDELLAYFEPSLASEYKVVGKKIKPRHPRRTKIIVVGCVAAVAIILIFRFILLGQPLFSG